MIDTQINPFDPTVSQDEVNRLFRKLKDTRLPEYPIVPDSADNDDYGAPLDWARRLKEYWETQYDWTKAQEEICSWHHFKTRIEGIDIHFVHEKAAASPSSSAKPIPLLLVHGWPGSFYEFSRVIGPLTSPPSADAGPAFDVVVVSLPGFAWSGPPPRRGWTLQDSARVFDTLMGRLGYFSYCAQGGDWAHFVLRELGSGRFPACRAVHTNMCPSEPPVAPGEEPTSREKWAEERLQWWLGRPRAERHMGFAVEMRTRPQTLGVALNDSPVGIMMWVGEKYNELTDPERCADLQDPEFNHRLATTLSLYFFTPPSIMTSMLCYYENVRHEDYAEFNLRPENRITVPMGFTSYKWDTSPTSERTVATTGNVKWFKERDYGGHFAALETPQEMVDDLRSFCGQWYSE
ncbi:putative epoxide hydrolase [Lasiodiplodia hormozganensis]|uniref:Epoxide hydrolase n=1 Tax=Lasiodiplodia hormozganensis TaxID=869390 RepID=A0AA40D3Y9_9PEZI|nr:putative epoxide hydrolase [Lasiodiplodia hormozganensis]